MPQPTTATSPERQARLNEAFLLLFVLFVLAAGGMMALAAKRAALPDNRQEPLNVNRASGAELAAALSVPPEVGARLAEERKRRGGFSDVDVLGRIPVVPDRKAAAEALRAAGMPLPATATASRVRSVLRVGPATAARILAAREGFPKDAVWEQVLRAPLVTPSRVSAAAPGLIARTWPEAQKTFLLSCGALALFLVAAHVLVRVAWPKADPFLLPVAGFLSALGVLLLFAIKDPLRDIPTYAAQAQGVTVGGGLALLLALSPWVAKAPLHRYGYLYALAAVVGTLVLGVAGAGPGGVRLSVAGVQPVEAVKILLVFFLAAYLAERGPLLNDPTRRFGPLPIPRREDLLPMAVLYALPLALFAIVRDLGPVLLLFGTFLMLLYLATGRGVYILLGLLALLAGGYMGYKLRFGVFETRVDMWLSPWNNAHKSGEHLALGWWGLSSGGVWGSGLGLGGSRFIPRAGSDLVFAALGEETGLWGTAAVLFCFLVFAGRGFLIARRAGTEFDRLLAAGLAALLSLQAVVITAGTLGLLPLAGITLPFLSYGKSSLVASWFLVGSLLAVSGRSPALALTPRPEFRRAAGPLAAFFVLGLGFAPLARLIYFQEIAADRTAGRTVRVPDADGVARPHVNPRLLALADRIPRGKLLDREGRVVAETRSGKRVYPYGEAMAHLVGYADPAVGGPTGLEAALAPQMRGFDNWAGLVPLWRRKDLPGFTLPQGQDVRLTIDAEWQKAALDALRRGAARVRDRRTGRPKNRGAVVVLDAQTGGVLVSVTSPAYDPNGLTPARMRALNANASGDFPLINRATAGFYPPGSTFKIVNASALFATGKADFTYVCNHVDFNVLWRADGQRYSRRRVVDDEGDRPHGRTDMTRAVAESCNIYFAHAAIAMGAEPFHEAAQQFGFARLPSLSDFGRDLADVGYGQGAMLASPMEMAGVAQAVAGGGKRRKPLYLLEDPPQEAAAPLTPEDAARLAAMMREVTRSGTAAGRFDGLPFAVAGKTGTAENRVNDRMSHSWFIGFAPADRPTVAFAVLVENGGYGASAAVPVARDVLAAGNLSR